MPTFPIPVFVACVLGFAGLWLWREKGHLSLLRLLIILCAGQSLIIALSQHYGITLMRSIQPVVASIIPPVAWLAYRNRVERKDIVYTVAPIIAAAAVLILPQILDLLLPGLFAIFGTLILLSAKKGADDQPDVLLASGDLPSLLWLLIGVALVASAMSDVLIVSAEVMGYPELRPWIISVFSVGNLLIIGAVGFSSHLETIDSTSSDQEKKIQVADPETWSRIQVYMDSKKPYLDPDLTLSRLARKIGLPVKSLSSTINLATGENVSRFINSARVAHAQKAMKDGASVTNAMLDSGFNTKSNFNREFLRIVGVSPSAWLIDSQKLDRK